MVIGHSPPFEPQHFFFHIEKPKEVVHPLVVGYSITFFKLPHEPNC